MNRFLYLQFCLGLLLSCIALSSYAQGGIVVEGANFNVDAGTSVRVEGGGVQNQANGAIDNEGDLYLDLDWVQTGAGTNYTGNGWMWFEGTANQSISSVSALSIPRLRVDNANRLILQNSITVETQLDLMNNGSIELGTHNLNILSGGTIINYDANHYIITNSTGVLDQVVGGSNVFFPVGNTNYNPAMLNNVGTVDNFSIRVEDQALDSYPAGPVDGDDVVSRTWQIEEATLGGSDVILTLQWNSPEETATFNRTASGISHWTGTVWDRSTYSNATNVGTNMWQQTRTGLNSFSPFVVDDISALLPIELLEFTAQRSSVEWVDLDWKTSSETNSKGFELERMLDTEQEFKAIAWIDGQENSTEVTAYQYKDPNAHQGISYYRLKQVDLDGQTNYSPIRAVNGWEQSNFISIYPNPTDDFLNIRFAETVEGNAQIRVYAIDGKLLIDRSEQVSVGTVLSLSSTQDLVAGTYLLQILFENGQSFTRRFIKKK